MKACLLVFGLLFPMLALAQNISGKVSNTEGQALIGASLHWLGTSIGTSTDNQGQFELSMPDISKKLIASFVGFTPDTIEVVEQTAIEFVLSQDRLLQEVVVQEAQEAVLISSLNAIKTEQITQTELRKAACCDLAGCFETQSTVQTQTTNFITNARELRILGLSGVYNQVLLDGFPMILGLSYTYGISSIPGTLVDNIFVSKGANSVLQGFESISGQINVETKEPDDTDRLLLNVYLNSFMEKQMNANFAFQHGKWSNLTSVHSVQPANKIDKDHDSFLDLPLLTRYLLFNKWKYGDEEDLGWNSRVGLRLLNESRVGGQQAFDPNSLEDNTTAYGQSVDIMQPEFWTKTGYRFNDRQSMRLFASWFFQDQNSVLGRVDYQARQSSLYANLEYDLQYEGHNLKTGISHRYLNLQEVIRFRENSLQRTYAGEYDRVENIVGVFAENTQRLFNDRLTWITGARADHHSQFGFKLSPRTVVKYDLKPRTILRANIGTGWRTVNLFSENIGLLVSSRDIIFAEALKPEEAINYGINFTQKFDTQNELLSGYLSLDFYRTDFQNQIFPDYDSDPAKAIIQNYQGTSISNGFQAELNLKIGQRFECKTGYNYLDVYRKHGEAKQVLPFNPKHKILATFGYKPLSNTFQFDLNLHWFGQQRLPNTQSNPVQFRRPEYSEPYAILNGQFTYNLSRIEMYIGCENIFNFRQAQPIISWQNPFGPYFDTSSVWGPSRGREGYIGMRYRLSQ